MPTPKELAEQAGKLDAEQWYEFLDELDEVSRIRRIGQPPDEPSDKTRDKVAEWVARKHLTVDSSLREIWYLPDAPDDEIRFLEINERLAISGNQIEPIDFGLEIEGVSFRLFVADVTPEKVELVQHDSTLLPAGWSLEGRIVWGRRR